MPLAFVNPSTIQQPLIKHGYDTMPSRAAPVFQMGKQHRNQHYLSQTKWSSPGRMPFTAGPVYPMPAGKQYLNHSYRSQAPRPGARRNRSKRYCKAESQSRKHNPHESSGSVVNDGSTGIDSGHAWIGSSNNTRVGKVWRTPSENLMIDG